MDPEPQMYDALIFVINWVCIVFFLVVMKYLMSLVIHQNIVSIADRGDDNFWDNCNPFTQICDNSIVDLSLILFRKLIGLLVLSLVILFMVCWAITRWRSDTFYIISTFLIFIIYIKSLSMLHQFTLSKFLILTSIVTISFFSLFYANPITYFVFCLLCTLFIVPLYMFYLNRQALKLSCLVLLFVYLWNILTFVSIALFINSILWLGLKYSNESGIFFLIALCLILLVPCVVVLLSANHNKLKLSSYV